MGGLLAAEGLEPAADVHLGVGFAAVVPGMGFVGSILVPFENGQLCIAAVDHNPPDRPVGLLTTDFTSIDRVNHRMTSVKQFSESVNLVLSVPLLQHLQIERRFQQALHFADFAERPFQRG